MFSGSTTRKNCLKNKRVSIGQQAATKSIRKSIKTVVNKHSKFHTNCSNRRSNELIRYKFKMKPQIIAPTTSYDKSTPKALRTLQFAPKDAKIDRVIGEANKQITNRLALNNKLQQPVTPKTLNPPVTPSRFNSANRFNGLNTPNRVATPANIKTNIKNVNKAFSSASAVSSISRDRKQTFNAVALRTTASKASSNIKPTINTNNRKIEPVTPRQISKTPIHTKNSTTSFAKDVKRLSRTVDCAKSSVRRSIKFLNANLPYKTPSIVSSRKNLFSDTQSKIPISTNDQGLENNKIDLTKSLTRRARRSSRLSLNGHLINELESNCLLLTPKLMQQLLSSAAKKNRVATSHEQQDIKEEDEEPEEPVKVQLIKPSSLLKYLFSDNKEKKANTNTPSSLNTIKTESNESCLNNNNNNNSSIQLPLLDLTKFNEQITSATNDTISFIKTDQQQEEINDTNSIKEIINKSNQIEVIEINDDTIIEEIPTNDANQQEELKVRQDADLTKENNQKQIEVIQASDNIFIEELSAKNSMRNDDQIISEKNLANKNENIDQSIIEQPIQIELAQSKNQIIVEEILISNIDIQENKQLDKFDFNKEEINQGKNKQNIQVEVNQEQVNDKKETHIEHEQQHSVQIKVIEEPVNNQNKLITNENKEAHVEQEQQQQQNVQTESIQGSVNDKKETHVVKEQQQKAQIEVIQEPVNNENELITNDSIETLVERKQQQNVSIEVIQEKVNDKKEAHVEQELQQNVQTESTIEEPINDNKETRIVKEQLHKVQEPVISENKLTNNENKEARIEQEQQKTKENLQIELIQEQVNVNKETHVEQEQQHKVQTEGIREQVNNENKLIINDNKEAHIEQSEEITEKKEINIDLPAISNNNVLSTEIVNKDLVEEVNLNENLETISTKKSAIAAKRGRKPKMPIKKSSADKLAQVESNVVLSEISNIVNDFCVQTDEAEMDQIVEMDSKNAQTDFENQESEIISSVTSNKKSNLEDANVENSKSVKKKKQTKKQQEIAKAVKDTPENDRVLTRAQRAKLNQ